GRAHVVGDQPLVEAVVLARGVAQHALGERQPLLPQPHVRSPAEACSAGVRAPMSSTTSVPVPSFVNTSSSRASGSFQDTTCTRATPPASADSIAAALGSMPSA